MEMLEIIYEKISTKFNIQALTERQKEAISAIASGHDVFVGTKTGSGKSLIYESAPLWLNMNEKSEDGTILIIAPLKSIMEEQVDRLNGLGFRAVFLGSKRVHSEEFINGKYQFIFGSPELLVGCSKWREILKHPSFVKIHRLTVVDEAHTVIQWGENRSEEGAFREWFSCIGELRSLNISVPLLALTATASVTNRRKILKSLCFKSGAKTIIDSPDRENIKLSVMQVSNNADPESIFKWIMVQLQHQKQDFDRHVIFCTSIKDCSELYCMFLRNICESQLYNMYHSKTPDSVKDSIRKDMSSEYGTTRVLICTNAAGMGVNFKAVNNVIHYGVPRDLDTFVQQMGRAGRDGSFSNEIIIYKNNKNTLKKIDPEMLKLLKSEHECRRKIISSSYMSTPAVSQNHRCCDICTKVCNCAESDCHDVHPICKWTEQNLEDEDTFIREVSDEDKYLLKQKLDTLKEVLNMNESVAVENIFDGLNDNNIKLIIQNISRIFNVDDVIKYASIWSYDVASKAIDIINEVFGDNEMYIMCESDSSISDDC